MEKNKTTIPAAGAVETASEILGYLQKETEELIATFERAGNNIEL